MRHFKAQGKLFMANELLSVLRKQPYKEPEVKDYGAPIVSTAIDEVDEAVATTRSRSSQLQQQSSTQSSLAAQPAEERVA